MSLDWSSSYDLQEKGVLATHQEEVHEQDHPHRAWVVLEVLVDLVASTQSNTAAESL